ncbi:MAG: hydrogenase [Desulfobacterales bacterium]|nr:hydrogenase [Desulfobacterales bacterium]
MNLIFFSVCLLIVGGMSPLFLYRRFDFMKTISISFICSGCLIGVISGLHSLFYPINIYITFDFFHYFKIVFFKIAFKMDHLSAFFTICICFISSLGAIYSFHYLNHPEKSFRTAVSYFFYSLLTISMLGVVTANNIITFALSWELMSLASFCLVLYEYDKKETIKAGYLYFVFTHAGAMFIFMAFGIIYAFTGSLEFKDLSYLSFNVKIIIFILTFIGFGAKAGVFPLHIWLPYAHPAAPSHVSAVMSGVMIKTGIYGILRIYSLLGTNIPIFGYITLIAGLSSGVLGIIYALGQHDLKKLLAYSSVENIGIILIGIGIGMIGQSKGNLAMAVFGFSGGLLHVLNHALFKSLLFMGAGMVLKTTGTSSIDQLGGLMKNMKTAGVTFLIGSIAICGLPPFNGFISEILIYFAGFKGLSSSPDVFVLSILAIISLAVIGALAIACFTKVIGIVFLGEPRTDKALKTNAENETSLKIPLILICFICLSIGLLPQIFVKMSFQGISTFGISVDESNLSYLKLISDVSFMSIIFFIIIGGMVAFRQLIYKGKNIVNAPTWGCGFTKPSEKLQYTAASYAFSIIEFYKPVAPVQQNYSANNDIFPKSSHFYSQISDIAEKWLVKAIVTPILIFFNKQHWIQHGDIHLYIGYILLTIVILLFFV